MNYFTISEFIINPDRQHVPLHVADKLVEYHFPIINPVREKKGGSVIVSKGSGFRSLAWEIAHGRSGSSQHTFKGKGAADYTCNEGILELRDLLIESAYTRVCWYPTRRFIHCDLKPIDSRQYYEADANGTWHFKRNR